MRADLLPASGWRVAVLWLMGLGLTLMLGTTVAYRLLHPDMFAPRPLPVSQAAPAGAMSQGDQLMVHVGELMRQVQANPTDGAALVELVGHFVELEQWAPAEQFGRRAIAALPDEVKAHYLLSVALHGLSRNEEAAASLEQAVALDDSASLRYSLGILYGYYLGQKDRAAEQFRKGLEDAAASEALRKDLEQELTKMQ